MTAVTELSIHAIEHLRFVYFLFKFNKFAVGSDARRVVF